MSDVVFMKLLFVAGLLGLFAGAVLIGHAMAWLQNRLASRRAKSERSEAHV